MKGGRLSRGTTSRLLRCCDAPRTAAHCTPLAHARTAHRTAMTPSHTRAVTPGEPCMYNNLCYDRLFCALAHTFTVSFLALPFARAYNTAHARRCTRFARAPFTRHAAYRAPVTRAW